MLKGIDFMAETLTEQEFVERFGSETEKQLYKKNGELKKGYKQHLIKQAEKYCVVKQLKNGNYSLTKQKQVPLNPEYIRSATGLYQYTCPLVLDYILSSNNEKTVVGMVSLAQKSHIITEYYRTVKHSPDLTSQAFKLNEDISYDCIKHVADTLNYHMEQTLKYLKQMQLIVYTTNYLVFKSDFEQVVSDDGTITTQRINYKPAIATDEEMEIYRNAVEQADIYAETNKSSERYYSKKAERWNKKFHEILLKHSITNMCEVYEIWVVHRDRCIEYRNMFEGNIDKIIFNLTKDFKNKLVSNASKRMAEIEIDEIELTYNFLTRLCVGNSKLNQRIIKKLQTIKKTISTNSNYKEIDFDELSMEEKPLVEFHIE